MTEKDFFSHSNPKDANRKNPGDRAKLAGILNPAIAENIANSGASNATYLELIDDLIDMWMKSPGHHDNILSDKAKAFGCGVFIKKGDSYMSANATQVFQWFSDVQYDSSKAKDKLNFKATVKVDVVIKTKINIYLPT